MFMKFTVKSVCKVCGSLFDNYKRYNSFLDEWELDSEICEMCKHKMIMDDHANSMLESSIHP